MTYRISIAFLTAMIFGGSWGEATEFLLQFWPTDSWQVRKELLYREMGPSFVSLRPLIQKPHKGYEFLGSVAVLRARGTQEMGFLRALLGVRAAYPIGRCQAYQLPNDPRLLRQWGLRETGALQAWPEASNDASIVIAVIDTGVDREHEDLGNAHWWMNRREIAGNGIDDDGNGFVDDVNGWDAVDVREATGSFAPDPNEDGRTPDNDPSDLQGHGTATTGLIAAQAGNGLGLAGMASRCWMLPVRAGYLAVDGNGYFEHDDLLVAVYYAAINGAQVINLSLGSTSEIPFMGELLTAVQQAGITIVAAAGNDAVNQAPYPAAYPGVISVGAVDEGGVRAPFSNLGPWMTLCAPGVNVLTTLPDNHYEYVAGTSIAAPFVTAAAALLLSQHPALTPTQVKERLQVSALPIDTLNPGLEGLLGAGFLNLPRLLSPLEPFRFRVEALHFQETAGNGDDIAEAGEQGDLQVTLANLGRRTAAMEATLEFSTPLLSVQGGPGEAPVWEGGESRTLRWNVSLASDLKARTELPFSVRFTGDLGLDTFAEGGWWVNEPAPIAEGFPVLLHSPSWSSPASGDLDGDGRKELVFGANDGKIHAVSSNGRELPGWPPRVIEDVLATPLVADLDGDGALEVAIGSFHGQMSVFDSWGNLRGGWPQDTGFGEIKASVTAFDAEGTGQLNLFAGTYAQQLWGWRPDGSVLPGFPLAIRGQVFASAAQGDLDGDGRKDLVLGTKDGFLYAVSSQGTVLPGWPVKLPMPIYSSPALADLDGDGRPEIVVGCGESRPSEEGRGWLFIFRANGRFFSYQWPVAAAGSVYGSPALGDLEGNGSLAVVYGDLGNKLWARRPNGSLLPGFPAVLPGSLRSSPVLGDVTGDGFPEILAGCGNGWLYALDSQGRAVPGWPKETAVEVYSTPLVEDFDGDGFVEVAVTGRDQKLYVWHTPGISLQRAGWPRFRHDSALSGFQPAPYRPKGALALGGISPFEGGIRFLALVHQGSVEPAVRVEARYDGWPVGFPLNDTGVSGDAVPGDGVWTQELFGSLAGAQGRWRWSMIASSAGDEEIGSWPRLTVTE